MDGTWTYKIPRRASGGVLVIREGRVAGGDGTYVCTGTCYTERNVVRMRLSYEMYNPQGSLGSIWGDHATQIDVRFEGAAIDDNISGKAWRPGFDEKFAVTMARYGG